MITDAAQRRAEALAASGGRPHLFTIWTRCGSMR
jgi:hypothetical protein